LELTVSILRLVPAIAAAALGLVFVIASAAKGADPALFAEQVGSYGIVGGAAAKTVALVLVPLEMALGAALLVCWRRRLSAAVAGSLLVLFIGVTAFGMATGKTEGCGCFGALSSRGPADVIKEDVLMLLLAGAAALPGAGLGLGGLWRGAAVVAAGLAGAGYQAAAPSLPLDDWATALRPGVAVASLDLGDAVADPAPTLVVLLDLAGPDIGDTTASLNGLLARPGAPRIVALAAADETHRGEYFWAHGPQFDVREIDHATLRRLSRRQPRAFLARGGSVVRTWNDRLPSPDELTQAVS